MHFSFIYNNLKRIKTVNVTKETKNILYELTYQNTNPNALIINGVSKEILYEGKRIVKFGSLEYKYNSQGIRTYKLYKVYNANGIKINQKEYNYDFNGELVGFNYNGVIYFYIKNM